MLNRSTARVAGVCFGENHRDGIAKVKFGVYLTRSSSGPIVYLLYIDLLVSSVGSLQCHSTCSAYRAWSAYHFIVRAKASDIRLGLIHPPEGKRKRRKQYGSVKESDACGLSV